MDANQLEQNRKRRLLVQVRDVDAAEQTLQAMGQPVEVNEDRMIILKSASALEHPEEINQILVNSGMPPIQLMIEEEDLEHYFLRLVGMDGGLQHE
jgi:ABC-2 type transport system ATP-binding protein